MSNPAVDAKEACIYIIVIHSLIKPLAFLDSFGGTQAHLNFILAPVIKSAWQHTLLINIDINLPFPWSDLWKKSEGGMVFKNVLFMKINPKQHFLNCKYKRCYFNALIWSVLWGSAVKPISFRSWELNWNWTVLGLQGKQNRLLAEWIELRDWMLKT